MMRMASIFLRYVDKQAIKEISKEKVMEQNSYKVSEVNIMKINRHGTIEVLRGAQVKKLFCPYRHYNDIKTGRVEAAFCGEECALFGEPQFYFDDEMNCDYVSISLCDMSYCCKLENFVDERIP